MDKRLEERYIVIKIKSLDYERLVKLCEFLQDNGIGTVDFVVIEEDWPEYGPTVEALKLLDRLAPLPEGVMPWDD